MDDDYTFTQVQENLYLFSPPYTFNEALAKEYIAAYKDTSYGKWIDAPHLFKLLNDMYLVMRRTSQDQVLTSVKIKDDIPTYMAQYYSMFQEPSQKTEHFLEQFEAASKVLRVMSDTNIMVQYQFDALGVLQGSYFSTHPVDQPPKSLFDMLKSAPKDLLDPLELQQTHLMNFSQFNSYLSKFIDTEGVWEVVAALYHKTEGNESYKDILEIDSDLDVQLVYQVLYYYILERINKVLSTDFSNAIHLVSTGKENSSYLNKQYQAYIMHFLVDAQVPSIAFEEESMELSLSTEHAFLARLIKAYTKLKHIYLFPTSSKSLEKKFESQVAHLRQLYENPKWVLSSEPMEVKPLEYGSFNQWREDQFVSRKTGPIKHRTTSRKVWVILSGLLTCWLPSFCIFKANKQAFREKLAINIIILLISASMLFFMIGLNNILCPIQKAYYPYELTTRQGLEDGLFAAAGKIYPIESVFFGPHQNLGKFLVTRQFAGRDVTIDMYPIRKPQFFCPTGSKELRIPGTSVNSNQTLFASLHNNLKFEDLQDYLNQPTEYELSFNRQMIKDMMDDEEFPRQMIIYQDRVYDLSGLVPNLNDKQYLFMDTIQPGFTDAILEHIGEELPASLEPFITQEMLTCLQVFYVGVLDTRDNVECIIINYFLLASSSFLVLVIFIKLISALKSTSSDPKQSDKHVILMMPCYTENKQSIQKTIDSLTNLKYNDHCKLLFVVCDGMVTGHGNAQPTPDIVLDVLEHQGSEPSYDMISLNTHNQAAIYSGLYHTKGHAIPYIVVVKTGYKEAAKAGNRGKRDSQMLLMTFLNKVLYNKPMTPFELHLQYTFKYVVGVDPLQYEYCLMVDADTTVEKPSLNILVNHFIQRQQCIGLCGETEVANQNTSLISMIQVYEYYISHNLSKAFESMFGTVTCLPGCFCMYRIHFEREPYLIHNLIIDQYGQDTVDTLHLKNLLSLGEDRYLTTLMIKQFPYHTLEYNPNAKCFTIAPDQYNVLLSQRRRWINSTIHNLFELLSVNMCGICCFSMRFVVFIDLFSTVIQPASIVYLTYLIVMIIIDSTNGNVNIPIIALYLLAIVYGMQMVIFVFKRQFQHVLWMIIYLLAMPVFGFMLPLYSFWHMDDFSWGNTRKITGDKQEEVTSDVSGIPLMLWSSYEQQVQPSMVDQMKGYLNEMMTQGTYTRKELREMLEQRFNVTLSKTEVNGWINELRE